MMIDDDVDYDDHDDIDDDEPFAEHNEAKCVANESKNSHHRWENPYDPKPGDNYNDCDKDDDDADADADADDAAWWNPFYNWARVWRLD